MSEIYTLNDGTEIDYSTEKGLRLIDCEIAKRLGWTNIRPSVSWTRIDWIGDKSEGVSNEVWPYTTDIQVALSVVSMERHFALWMKHDENGEPIWEANVNGKHYTYRTNKSPALAICLAWLAMKDAEND
jgi:hypothetical protein